MRRAQAEAAAHRLSRQTVFSHHSRSFLVIFAPWMMSHDRLWTRNDHRTMPFLIISACGTSRHEDFRLSACGRATADLRARKVAPDLGCAKGRRIYDVKERRHRHDWRAGGRARSGTAARI
jgi:hypothetical protein